MNGTRPPIQTGATSEVLFDRAWYLDKNPDVRNADIDAWDHYMQRGWRENRDPAPWFSASWYQQQVLTPLELNIEPLQHFLETGRARGFTASPKEEKAAIDTARSLFDAEFYLDMNSDVRNAGIEPWEHFLAHGWQENRAASPRFDTAYYTRTHLSDLKPRRNPLLHYVLIGRAKGLTTRSEEPKSGVDGACEDLIRWVKDRVEAAEPDQAKPLDRLIGSALLDLDFLAAQNPSFKGLSRAEAAAHYLESQNETTLDPSPAFSNAFYLSHYADFIPSEVAPLVHFLIAGRNAGFYPNATVAFRDVAILRKQISISRETYMERSGHKPRHEDPIVDYVLYGHHIGASIDPDLNECFIRQLYRPMTHSFIGAPAAFYARHRDRPWVYRSPGHLQHDAALVRESDLFDSSFYMRKAGIEDEGIDPAQHYVTIGTLEGLPCSQKFDTGYYLNINSDVAASRIQPVLHFKNFGASEGRRGVAPLTQRIAGKVEADPARATIIIFSHEASRTGAPIVALNLVRELSKTWNVISWIDTDGPLTEEFREFSMEIRLGFPSPGNLVAELQETKRTADIRLAIVNSVVCHTILAGLRLAGVSVISLIHEFADYVSPTGTLSRMALRSDVVVFPAEVVRDACRRELARLGVGREARNTVIRPQGYNVGTTNSEGPTPEDILAMVNVDRSDPRQRILFGAGYVQPRKGVDLFLQAARVLMDDPDYDWTFIWVGGNYQPNVDMITSVYLAHQVRETGLEARMHFLPEQKSLDAFWKIADVFFLSSRLDPYPNVALDALAEAVPVVCFRGATGIAQLANDYPFAVRAVPFADILAAAAASMEMTAQREEIKAEFAGSAGEKMLQTLSFERYVEDVEGFMERARKRGDEVQACFEALSAIDPEDSAAACRHLTHSMRLVPYEHPDFALRSLAEFMVDDQPELTLRLSKEDTAILTGIAGYQSSAPWLPGFGAADGSAAALGEITLVLFVRDEAALELLYSEPPEITALEGCRKIVAATATHELMTTLSKDLPGWIQEVGFHPHAAEAAMQAAKGAIPLVALADVSPRPYNKGSLALRRPEVGLLLSLGSGAAIQYLMEIEQSDAVFAAMSLGERAPDAEMIACSRLATSPFPPIYPPRFSGLYRSSALNAFAADRLTRLREEAGALEGTAWDGYAGLSFIDWQRGEARSNTILPQELF